MQKFRVKKGLGYHFQKYMGDHLRDEDIIAEGNIVYLSDEQLLDPKIQDQMHKLESVDGKTHAVETVAVTTIEAKQEVQEEHRKAGRPRKIKMITNSTVK